MSYIPRNSLEMLRALDPYFPYDIAWCVVEFDAHLYDRCRTCDRVRRDLRPQKCNECFNHCHPDCLFPAYDKGLVCDSCAPNVVRCDICNKCIKTESSNYCDRCERWFDSDCMKLVYLCPTFWEPICHECYLKNTETCWHCDQSLVGIADPFCIDCQAAYCPKCTVDGRCPTCQRLSQEQTRSESDSSP